METPPVSSPPLSHRSSPVEDLPEDGDEEDGFTFVTEKDVEAAHAKEEELEEGEPSDLSLAGGPPQVVSPSKNTNWRDQLALAGGLSAFTMAGGSAVALEKLTFAACFFGPGVYTAFGIAFFLLHNSSSESKGFLEGQLVQLQEQLLAKEIENKRQAELLGGVLVERDLAQKQVDQLKEVVRDKDVEIAGLKQGLEALSDQIQKLKKEAEDKKELYRATVENFNRKLFISEKLKENSRDKELQCMLDRVAFDYDILYNEVIKLKALFLSKDAEWGDFARLLQPAEEEIQRLKKEAEDKIEQIFSDPCSLRPFKEEENRLGPLLHDVYLKIHKKMYPDDPEGESDSDQAEDLKRDIASADKDFSKENASFFLEIGFQYTHIMSCFEMVLKANSTWLQEISISLRMRKLDDRDYVLIEGYPQIPGVNIPLEESTK